MIRFVTGTDTGVGKTVASAWLALGAGAGGLRVRYLKPVQTGLAPGAKGGDADFVGAAADVEAEELLRFDEPLAPAVAAGRAGRPIDFEALVAGVSARASSCDLLLVEGAGGVLVPITESRTMADLAAAIRAELVVCVRPGLGTLNHTALTLEAATARGLAVAGLVVCGIPPRPSVAEETNRERLGAMAPVIEVIPRIRGLSVEAGRAAALSRAWRRRANSGEIAPEQVASRRSGAWPQRPRPR